MSSATPVEIPVFNVNDESVVLTAWLVNDGDTVREGQHLAEIETSKAVVELMAPASGTIQLSCKSGVELGVGTIVAYIGKNGASQESARLEIPLPPSLTSPSDSDAKDSLSPVTRSGTRFSKKAWELLLLHAVPAAAFADRTMVREDDVLEYLRRTTAASSPQTSLHHALEGISLDGITFPTIFSQQDSGRVASEFLQELNKDPDSFLNLPSSEKCNLYRSNGAEIGEDVQIGKRSLIFAPRIQLGDCVRIGENSTIRLRERFAVDHLSSFREGLSVRGGTAVFGANTFAGSRIQIGGGGSADPWALLVVGDDVYLGDDLFINICRPVLIGREVFLTQRTTVVTHNIGHSILEGYENAFAPIVLEDFSQVGMNCTLYAGCRVGHSAAVASNSYVISSIPKGKLAMGVPATVVRDAARPITRTKQVQIAVAMLRQFRELLTLKGVSTSDLVQEPNPQFTVSHQGKIFRIGFIESVSSFREALPPAEESIVWTLDSSGAHLTPGITLIDLLAKTYTGPTGLFADSAREFLRKRGIRLQPGPWRYEQGLI